MVAKFIAKQIIKYGSRRITPYLRRPSPASKKVGAGTEGAIPTNKQSIIKSSLSGTEYSLPKRKNVKGVKFVNDKTETQRFQDNVKDLIGLDLSSMIAAQKRMFKKKK